MSTEFQTLKECIEAKKGAFIGVIIKQSDLKSGTSNKGTKSEKDWTNKRFTISGEDGIEIELTAWNVEIDKFTVGNKYEFTGFWFKEYNDEPQLAVGKFGKVNLIGTATIPTKPGQTTMPEPDPAGRFEEPAPQSNSLPEMGGSFEEFSEQQCIQLLQIEQTVKRMMTKFDPTKIHEGQKVGMHTKEIYRESKKFKFEKASQE